jgi:hypothetical protein
MPPLPMSVPAVILLRKSSDLILSSILTVVSGHRGSIERFNYPSRSTAQVTARHKIVVLQMTLAVEL